MNEIDVVVDVRQSPDNGELLVVKQKYLTTGEVRAVGPPVETRLDLMASLPLLRDFGLIVHRRARPIFDTLPESERLAILKAVAPLRGLDRERWSTSGAEPVDGLPDVYAVRATPELRALIAGTESKGIEVVDIVRDAAFDEQDVPAGTAGENA
jgi:hypothetical protein